MNKYIIIGNGTAAAGCIEGIRSTDTQASVTVISAEKHPVYCRPLISYYLEGKTTLEKIGYRPSDFYKKNDCTVLYGASAVKIDSNKKLVLLNDGKALEYTSLCVATGSMPFIPPTPGLGSVMNSYTFMTLEDALTIERAITPESRVLIMGAGLIGLKCAEGLRDRVKSISVCDLAPNVLSSILDGESAELVRKHLEDNGISFLLGNTVNHFDSDRAFMKNGEVIDFDIFISAVGVRPHTELIVNAGGKCNRGITVDNHMRTSLENVYAAGDCTESEDVSDGAVKIMALMPNAYMQGFCAGVNMAGGEKVFDNAIPMNSIGFFGLHIMTAGSKCTAENGTIEKSEDSGNIRRLFIKDERLIGFVFVGEVERVGIYTNLIRSRTNISSIKLNKHEFYPNLYEFSAEYRRKTLGGIV